MFSSLQKDNICTDENGVCTDAIRIRISLMLMYDYGDEDITTATMTMTTTTTTQTTTTTMTMSMFSRMLFLGLMQPEYIHRPSPRSPRSSPLRFTCRFYKAAVNVAPVGVADPLAKFSGDCENQPCTIFFICTWDCFSQGWRHLSYHVCTKVSIQ